jgi:hypothetical protein
MYIFEYVDYGTAGATVDYMYESRSIYLIRRLRDCGSSYLKMHIKWLGVLKFSLCIFKLVWTLFVLDCLFWVNTCSYLQFEYNVHVIVVATLRLNCYVMSWSSRKTLIKLLLINCGYQCGKAGSKIYTIREVIRYHFPDCIIQSNTSLITIRLQRKKKQNKTKQITGAWGIGGTRTGCMFSEVDSACVK